MGRKRKRPNSDISRYLSAEEFGPGKLPKPPQPLIDLAMKDLPSVLRDMFQFPGDDNAVALNGRVSQLGHSSDVAHWALYEHMKEDRVRLGVKPIKINEFIDSETHYPVTGEVRSSDVSITSEEEYIVVKATPKLWRWWDDLYHRDTAGSDTRSSSELSIMKPAWDRQSRTLSFQNETIISYSRHAKNQFLVLDCFQEEDWPNAIDDPLPVDGAIDSRSRAQNTARDLNKRRLVKSIRFGTDGTGEGFTWSEDQD